MKYHIEKNTVQETLIIPTLRKKEMHRKIPSAF